jgi:hypothetical protein
MAGRDHAAVAARSNADWCDLVCRTYGVETRFTDHSWVALRRTPPLYPDAVTLTGGARAGEVLRLVDSTPGCSVKDSFADLELAGDGLRVLFEAEWIYRAPSSVDRIEAGLPWVTVRTPEELRAWGAAHGGAFHPELLDNPAVTILAVRDGDRLAAGVIGHRTSAAVDVSNLFTTTADPDRVWASAVAALSAWAPGLPLVGYEGDESLADARSAGFTAVGPLRVWLRD